MENKKGFGMFGILIVMLVSLFIASLWNTQLFGKEAFVKNAVKAVLDPSIGILFKWNLIIGFIIIVGIISFILTITQKLLTNQEELKKMKKEQKLIQEEMKKYKNHPEKLLELQKKQLEFIPKTFDLTMKPLLYTSIPIILLFRWFSEFLNPVWGGWWILYYLVSSMIFSGIFKKVLDVA
jgi:uncharacterized membrane protein (DUF106 family)